MLSDSGRNQLDKDVAGGEVVRSRDWLDRFRPAGAPGAAARRGVPNDVDETEQSLLMLFQLLVPVQQECHALIAAAEQEALARRKVAEASVAALLADADSTASAARAETYALIVEAAPRPVVDDAVPSPLTCQQTLMATRMPLVVDAVYAELHAQLAALGGAGSLPSADLAASRP